MEKITEEKKRFFPLLIILFLTVNSGCTEIIPPKYRNHLIIERISSSETINKSIGNLTKSDINNTPILLNTLESMVINTSFMYFSADITDDEATMIIEVFEANGMPLREHPEQYFYYYSLLICLDLTISVS